MTKTNGLTITLNLTSLAQVAAIQNALDLVIDMEKDRKAGDPEWSKKDDAQVLAAKQVLAILTGSAS